ncbi:T9SS type A sorting domain-containing protein [Empedobacter tilapiae]|uniref:T9SS type A sorting domain-containing protein n=1 Tax=Empedobacter tilapiae TaxID=2491114 RepID=A0A4Z1BII5_9FLAO|nr:T9SS type A sorting domain-containing protein [Empedobacter tilapiae]TGN29204.1 T9SS type A sorting domain-containing protein [Empedobacter tilapiae]
MKLKLFTLAAIFGLASTKSYAQYITTTQFQNPQSVSNDGLVAGYGEWAGPYLIWNADTDKVEAIGGIAPGNNHGGVATFTPDGKYISGTSETNTDPTVGEMSRYNMVTKKWETLGFNYNTGYSDADFSSGYYISADGNTAVGLSYEKKTVDGQEVPRAIAFAWNSIHGNSILEPFNPSAKQGRANAVSNDGSVIIGWSDMRGPWKAHYWKRNPDGTYQKGQYILVDPKGSSTNEFNQLGEARAISGDGKWIGGKSDASFENAWIWSEETGVIDLGRIAKPEENNVQSWVTSINDDGSLVLGYTISKQWVDSAPVYTPFIWTKETGIQDFNNYVINTLKFDMKGDKIYVPTQLSENEKYIVGWGLDATNIKMFRIQLPKLGIEEVDNIELTTLFPNPASKELNIDSKENIKQVTVFNLTGQQLFSKKGNSKTSKIDVSNLKSGVYIVEVKTDKTSKTYKIIKK